MSHTDAKHRRNEDLNAKVKSEGRTEGGHFQTLGRGRGPSSPAVLPRQPQDSDRRPDDWKKRLQLSGNALIPCVVGVPCALAVAENGDPRTREGDRVWCAVLPGHVPAPAAQGPAARRVKAGQGAEPPEGKPGPRPPPVHTGGQRRAPRKAPGVSQCPPATRWQGQTTENQKSAKDRHK